MPPLESRDQGESEHPLNYDLHGRVQTFFTDYQADFATAFPRSSGLKLAELDNAASIVRARALQFSRGRPGERPAPAAVEERT